MDEMKKLAALAYELREDVVNMVVEGKGGHIGGDMSVMDILVSLYFKEMNISPENQESADRDRFYYEQGAFGGGLLCGAGQEGFFSKRRGDAEIFQIWLALYWASEQ